MHKIPYPPDTGTNQRIYSMVSFLRKEYRVGLVMPEYKPEISALFSVFDNIWYAGNYTLPGGKLFKFIYAKIYTIYFNLFYRKHLAEYTDNILGKYNVLAAYALYKICLSNKPSLIICQKIVNSVLSTAIAHKFNIPVIIDTHDLYKLQLDEKTDKINVNLNQMQLASARIEDEINLLKLYDALIAIQFDEAAVLKKYFPEKKVITALHPAIARPVNEDTSHIFTNNPTLLFVGSSSEHNKDALEYFIGTHLSFIIERIPSVKLMICGSVTRQMNIIHPHIEVLGRIDDLQPFYQQATLVINPVRFGSGLKIKTVDALSFGKCVVTTPTGCEGLPDVMDTLVCVPPEKLGEEMVDLLNNRNIILSYEKAALDYIKQYLTPEACYSELMSWIQRTLVENDDV
ncbi:glycosyltransferase family 4 protein [Rhodocytophaga rosea]|uniref:Glycosyltransferase family 4 protein n=1 Tax=Rhodocytophaga rosea TaxID=2704465 RepID=A0A6C0GNJ1_9BACT|nr:glycosyltransferase family 4 protein [Rhodocytophaga rosea]QHT69599.1 glycosyltransferase family 4 protein [Rhodocytophaga rosea]